MARDSSGSKNQPQFSATGTSSQAADLSEVANYGAFVGNRKVGPANGTATGPGNANTGRTTSSGADVWEGLEWHDTTDGGTYKYIGGGWTLWSLPWTDFTPTTSGMTIGTTGAQLYAKYKVTNGEVHVRVGWRLGASPVINDVTLSYPIPVASWLNDLAQVGFATFYDQSAGTTGRIRGVLYKTSTGVRVTYESTGSVMLPVAPTTPFTWTSGDEIHIAAVYPS